MFQQTKPGIWQNTYILNARCDHFGLGPATGFLVSGASRSGTRFLTDLFQGLGSLLSRMVTGRLGDGEPLKNHSGWVHILYNIIYIYVYVYIYILYISMYLCIYTYIYIYICICICICMKKTCEDPESQSHWPLICFDIFWMDELSATRSWIRLKPWNFAGGTRSLLLWPTVILLGWTRVAQWLLVTSGCLMWLHEMLHSENLCKMKSMKLKTPPTTCVA